MFNYFVAIPLLLPLIGVLLMEQGVYGVSIGKHGYPNGAFQAYFLYVATFLITFLLCKERTKKVIRHVFICRDVYRRYFYWACLFHILLTLVMLFIFDAYHVWVGSIGKGEFRASLGSYGFIAYTITKYLSPSVLAYLAYLYVGGRGALLDKMMLVFALVLGLVFGSTWGFKTTGISLILPSLLILYWGKGFWAVAKLGLSIFPIVLVMGIIFDDEGSFLILIEAVLIRLTVIQGDVSWMIWDMYQDGYEFPSYIRTLTAAMGDRLLSFLLDLDRQNYQQWVLYHFDLLINQLVGLPLESVEGGHTIVGTPFSEGLIMSGLKGILIIAAFGGWLCAFLHNKIQMALVRRNGIATALLSTYFCLFVFSWMIGGAIVQIFHISVFIGFLVAFLTVYLMRYITLFKVRYVFYAVN